MTEKPPSSRIATVLELENRLLRTLVRDCQREIAAYLPPDSGISREQCFSKLLARLDGPQARAALGTIEDPQPAAPEEPAKLTLIIPLPHLKNVQRVVQGAGWGFLELEHIEQVLLADAAVIAVTSSPKVDLLSDEENAALLKHAEETWTDLQANDLGGFSNGNRPFWLVHAFKQAIETFGRRDVGLHHSQDELEAIGAIKPRR